MVLGQRTPELDIVNAVPTNTLMPGTDEAPAAAGVGAMAPANVARSPELACPDSDEPPYVKVSARSWPFEPSPPSRPLIVRATGTGPLDCSIQLERIDHIAAREEQLRAAVTAVLD